MNNHPHIGWSKEDSTPRHIIGGTLTGWQHTDAIRQVKCPKCGSDPGYLCETPKGRVTVTPHWQRTRQFVIGDKVHE